MTQVPIPKEPVVFNKFASSIINPGADIEALAVSKEMDFEVVAMPPHFPMQ